MRQKEIETDSFWSHGSFAGLPPRYTNFARARVVVLPVPYDSTSEWRTGSRDGPQAIINASQYLELYDVEQDREIGLIGICTLPQLEPLMNSPRDMIGRVYRVVRQLLRKGKIVVMLGGEHTLSLGAVRAFKETFPSLSVLQLDAHADLRDKYLGTKYGQACVMRRILELCPVTQVGVRSLSWEEKQFLTENKMRPFYMSQLGEGKATVEQIVSSLSGDVYVTIDVDVLDPSIMPAVGTPEPGGMLWQQVLDIIQSVARRRRVVGFDVVEFCPGEGSSSCAFLLAKLIYKFIGYIVP